MNVSIVDSSQFQNKIVTYHKAPLPYVAHANPNSWTSLVASLMLTRIFHQNVPCYLSIPASRAITRCFINYMYCKYIITSCPIGSVTASINLATTRSRVQLVKTRTRRVTVLKLKSVVLVTTSSKLKSLDEMIL